MTDVKPDFRPIDRSEHELLIIDDNPATRYATARAAGAAPAFARARRPPAPTASRRPTIRSPPSCWTSTCPTSTASTSARILRSRPGTARLPVLHLTAAYVTDEDKVRGLDSGADAYLTRPVEPAVLVATVQALVRTRVAEEAMRRSEVQVPRDLRAGAEPASRCWTTRAAWSTPIRPCCKMLARADSERDRPPAERLRAARMGASDRRLLGRRGRAVELAGSADAAARRLADLRRMELLAAHRAGRDDGGGHRRVAARRAGAPAPAAARSRAHRARRGRAGEPHEGRLHRGAVARAAHAAQRDHELDPRAAPARRHPPRRCAAWRPSSATARRRRA